MKTVYLNEDNTVREIIPEYALPPEKWYSEAFARRCVEVQDDVEQGWRYNPETGQATPDTRPPEPKPPTVEDITLDMLAEHEARLCMLELTTTATI